MNVDLTKIMNGLSKENRTPKKILSALIDLYPDEHRDRNLLKIVVDSGVVSEIQKNKNIDFLHYNAMKRKLVDDYFIIEDAAEEAIMAWINLYSDIDISSFKKIHNGKCKVHDDTDTSLDYISSIHNNTINRDEIKSKSTEVLSKLFDSNNFDNKLQIGDYITLGKYPQSAEDVLEPIEWLVLAVESDRALIISKYGIICKPYNDDYKPTSWEKSTLRNWLNSEFIQQAFNDDEQDIIHLSKVMADKNSVFIDTKQGNNTNDKVFILSVKDVEKYFKSNFDRAVEATQFAKDSSLHIVGRLTYRYNDNCGWWWMRSLGYSNYDATYVLNDGTIYYDGEHVDSMLGLVRPVLWIKLKRTI